jgi:hypothetical protein
MLIEDDLVLIGRNRELPTRLFTNEIGEMRRWTLVYSPMAGSCGSRRDKGLPKIS